MDGVNLPASLELQRVLERRRGNVAAFVSVEVAAHFSDKKNNQNDGCGDADRGAVGSSGGEVVLLVLHDTEEIALV